MAYGSAKGDDGRISTQVWEGLGNEVRQQTIRLLVQLAFNLVITQSARSSVQEKDHAKAHLAQS